MAHSSDMTFNWDDSKNARLKEQRNISFEEIVICIGDNQVVDVLEHPSTEKYPDQYLYLVEYGECIYVVPFVYDDEKAEIFLKTIYPSRKYTRRYLSGEIRNEE